MIDVGQVQPEYLLIIWTDTDIQSIGLKKQLKGVCFIYCSPFCGDP